MEDGSRNLFITGKAGTGKSTLLQYFRGRAAGNVVVLAPTGVAAVNIKGQTIHSFFGFRPDVTPGGVRGIRVRKSKKSLYRNLETVVIDEISMVRADLMDCVDLFLRLHGPEHGRAFGGVQMILIGDLYQLPPVVTSAEKSVFGRRDGGAEKNAYRSPYFFDARVFGDFAYEMIELEKIYRQKDGAFIGLLNAVRNNSVNDAHLDILNRRCRPDFRPREGEFYIHLTTTNAMADGINNERLSAIREKARRFQGEISGDFDPKGLPTRAVLELKTGAQVMLLNNDPGGRWINGTIGRVRGIGGAGKGADVVSVRLAGGETVEVTPFTWEMFRFFYDPAADRLDSETVGSFTQYPLRLAWAVTIHKSQGKTFPKVIVDIGRGTFSHGQVYVALSRAVSLGGLVLKRPVLKKHIWMDRRITEFMTGFQYRRAEERCPLDERRRVLEEAAGRKKAVDIVYLKADDQKTRRRIRPRLVGEMEYLGKTYLGVEAYCCERRARRIFRVDRILEIKAAGE